MANIRAFQACDASSILAARTNIKTGAHLQFLYWYEQPKSEPASSEQSEPMRVRTQGATKMCLHIFVRRSAIEDILAARTHQK